MTKNDWMRRESVLTDIGIGGASVLKRAREAAAGNVSAQ